MTLRVISRALLSVSDKTKLLELAEGLSRWKVELISTGGTRAVLAEAGYAVKDVSEVTGFPEMLGGRVKTLHPRIHAGILAVRENREHVETLLEHNIQWIDLVVCNLYPFEATVAQESSTPEDIIENIDIGGPTLVRAAAKNHRDLTVLTEPAQYSLLLKELEENECSESSGSFSWRGSPSPHAEGAAGDRPSASSSRRRAARASRTASSTASPWRRPCAGTSPSQRPSP